MRRKLVVGNWKMHGDIKSNKMLLDDIINGLRDYKNADYVVCVNFDRLENKTHADSVTRIIWDIKTTPKWLHKVWSVSRERNLPLENCLRSEAEYVLSQRNR